jgi:5-methylcytosine-specific restriction endonuclease McrA
LTPEDFVLDHKVPIAKLNTRAEMLEESNLVVACRKCNKAKGTMGYDEFLKQMETG